MCETVRIRIDLRRFLFTVINQTSAQIRAWISDHFHINYGVQLLMHTLTSPAIEYNRCLS